jgi:hypothetical protein
MKQINIMYTNAMIKFLIGSLIVVWAGVLYGLFLL